MNLGNQKEKQGVTYRDAGVDLSASQMIKEKIKEVAKRTYGENVVGGVGGFGAMYRLGDYRSPILVSSTDPVGTKLMVATMANNFSNIGADLVNACVNDLIVIGAHPLFFLDYIATSTMDPEVVETIVNGISESCQNVSCALIGGETSEMPGVFAGNNIDLSGFVVGVVEEDEMLRPLDMIQSGDTLNNRMKMVKYMSEKPNMYMSRGGSLNDVAKKEKENSESLMAAKKKVSK